ncbi:MAG TPA: hypothetical protein VKY57_16155 [Chitinispirillaceae bacterium]|nr:hypothetical protein [Chitinispirillaceae bacterium]
MPSFYLIYIIISVVVAFSVVLSVADWIYLYSLSSKITSLELEIEKKAREYDLLKKNNNKNSLKEPGESERYLSEISTGHEQIYPQSIEIVRNVRQPFEQQNSIMCPKNDMIQTTENSLTPDTDNNTATHCGNYGTSEDMSISEKETVNINTYDTPEQIGLSGNKNNDYDNDQYIKSSNYVLDVVSDPQNLSSEPVTLPLFSELNKDADFKTLWSRLSDLLRSNKNVHIFIDFNNIHFLYEKELDFLEKICHLTIAQGSCLLFVNYDNELMNLFKKRPLLLSLLT